VVLFDRRPRPPSGGRRILFVGEAVSLAHVARPAVLARWAREAGHEVFFACGSRYAGVARSEGLEPIELPTVGAALFYRRLSQGRFFYRFEELREYVRAELELIGRLKPDLVVGDFRLTLPISAKLAGVECSSSPTPTGARRRSAGSPLPRAASSACCRASCARRSSRR